MKDLIDVTYSDYVSSSNLEKIQFLYHSGEMICVIKHLVEVEVDCWKLCIILMNL